MCDAKKELENIFRAFNVHDDMRISEIFNSYPGRGFRVIKRTECSVSWFSEERNQIKLYCFGCRKGELREFVEKINNHKNGN